MPNFILLTSTQGKTIPINVDLVEHVHDALDGDHAVLIFNDGTIHVRETVEQIIIVLRDNGRVLA